MSSIAEISEALTEALNERAKHLALETGFIKRVRKFDGADFAQSLIEHVFGSTRYHERRATGRKQASPVSLCAV